MVLALFDEAGTSCSTSQCSTTLRPSGRCPPLQLRAVVGGLPGVGLELCTCRMSTERVPHRSDACDHGSERPTAEVKRGTSGAGGNMSSDSLSVADSLRTSSKGPRLATVASPLHFMYLRARLEGLEPPTNGYEGRMRRTQGVARLRNRLQLLGTRQAWIPGSRRLSHRSPRILRTGCGRC